MSGWKPSTIDDVELARAVEERFLDVCQTHQRVLGIALPIPKNLDGDMMLWRRVRVRHASGVYCHTPDEIKSVKVIAQWVLDKNCELKNQPKRVLQWKD